MKEILIPIDAAGRVVIPKSVRQELAIQSGDLLKVTIRGLDLLLSPTKEEGEFVRKGRALIFSSGRGERLNREAVETVLSEEREGRQALCGGVLFDLERKQ